MEFNGTEPTPLNDGLAGSVAIGGCVYPRAALGPNDSSGLSFPVSCAVQKDGHDVLACSALDFGDASPGRSS
jgi:hypothetical protein